MYLLGYTIHKYDWSFITGEQTTFVLDDGLLGLPDDVHEVDLPRVVAVAAHREVLLRIALVLHEPPTHLNHL